MSAKNHTLDSDNYQPLIEKIRTVLNQQLAQLMLAMFNNADDILFNLAEKASGNEDQKHYIDTMRLLRVERDAIQQSFSLAIQDVLKTVSPQDVDAPSFPSDEDELSLVDQDEMEDMIVISSMASRAVDLFGVVINHLQARLDFLALKTSQTIDKQALEPKHICEAFTQSLKHLELSSNNKLVMNKLFEQ